MKNSRIVYPAKFFSGILLLIAVTLLYSCAEDPEEPPRIGSMSPQEGSFDMIVTITGTDFSLEPGGNVVTFNGVVAEIDSVEKNKLTVIVPRGGSSGPVTVTTNKLVSTGYEFRYYDIYISGNEYDPETGITRAKLWKNGLEVELSDPDNARTVAVTASGSIPYTTGFKDPPAAGAFFPYGYWRDLSFITLGYSDYVRDISKPLAYNGDLYVAGSYYDTAYEDRPTFARYWKNGTIDTVMQQDGYENGWAYAIAASETDSVPNVHVGGVVKNGTDVRTAYWFNGELIDTLGSDLAIRDIYVDGNDLYRLASGTDGAGNPLPIKYWKNKELFEKGSTTLRNEAKSIVVLNTNIYIFGSEAYSPGGVMGARLWGEPSNMFLFEDEIESYGIGAAVVENKLFMGGHVRDGINFRAYYKYAGVVYYITDGTKSVEVTGMFVR